MGCSFKAKSDERRRKILSIFGKKDANAGEFAWRFKITQPTVSNHLKIFKVAGLIKERKVKRKKLKVKTGK